MIILGILVGIGIGVECATGIIEQFVKNTNSFASRHDDVILTLLIAKDYPIWGIGLATDPLPIWDVYYERYEYLRMYRAYQNAMSCGIGNYLCMGGIPFGVVYLISLVKYYQKMIEKKGMIVLLLLSIVVVMIVLEEPLLPTPFFLISFYYGWTSKKISIDGGIQ